MPPSHPIEDRPSRGPSPDRGEAGARRLRLLSEAQGRPLDEAYQHQGIRADLEAEAADPSIDSLLTPDMLAHLRELLAEKDRDSGPVPAGAGAGPELFGSTDAVVIVPGFLASSLSDTGRAGLGLIWASPTALATNLLGTLQLGPYDGEEADLDPWVHIVPTGPLPILYDLLRLALEVRRYATEILPIDWRKDLEIGAKRLASRLRALGAGPSPVHLVAHSQGALVARRALQLLGPAEAARIVRNLVLLGPANFGSFSAALALGGGHQYLAIARRLSIEPPQGFQQVLASMTGLYQLLPWDDVRVPWLREHSLGRGRFWKGGIDFARLDRFHGWGAALDASFFDARTTVIVGDNHGVPTVGAVAYEGMTLRDDPDFGLAGDGTVPHSCAVLPGVRTFLAPGTEHTTLAAHRGVIDAVLDVLAGRWPRLHEFPSEPEAHLGPGAGPPPPPQVLGVPAPCKGDEVDAPAAKAPTVAMISGALGGLNGSFLSSYDGRKAQPGLDTATRWHRGEQLFEKEGIVRQQVSEVERRARLPSFELILDASNLLPFDFLRTGDRLGRAVVKIQRTDGGAGTGFLVAPGILLTNHHVLPDAATAAVARAVANYEASPAGDPAGRTASAAFDPRVLFLTNADLDFTFCAVTGLDFLGIVPPNRDSLNVMISEYVNIIQHPRGRHKEIVLQDNRVVRSDNVVVQYSCDTEPGSSGSPVFNNQWKLVALHHASVVVDGPEGRHAPDAAPGARYLNEGIRLSAIATWLETADANAPGCREAVARLRGAFRGPDPQIGFFGALGRRSGGKGAAEVVVESYLGGADALDLAYWDLRGFARTFRDRLGEIARVVADMGVDVWCLAHSGAEMARALCHRLESNFQLEYTLMIDPEGVQAGMAILYRRDKGLSVARLDREDDGPWGVLARVLTRRGEFVAFRVVPVADEEGGPAFALIEDVVRRGAAVDGAEYLLLGGAEALRVPFEILAAGGHRPLVLAAEPRDGAIVLLEGAGSRVDLAFASPNLDAVGPRPEFLEIVRDRELPRGVEVLGGPRPVALRLTLNGRQSPSPFPLPTPTPIPLPKAAPDPIEVVSRPPEAPPSATPAEIDDALLERKLRAILGPMIAQMLAGLPPDAGGGRD